MGHQAPWSGWFQLVQAGQSACTSSDKFQQDGLVWVGGFTGVLDTCRLVVAGQTGFKRSSCFLEDQLDPC